MQALSPDSMLRLMPSRIRGPPNWIEIFFNVINAITAYYSICGI
jgi:hypothetical protein